MNPHSNRKLMAVRDLTARADPAGVERYVAGLSHERPRVYEMQDVIIPQARSRINTIDMVGGVATFNYGRKVDFIEMDRTEKMLEENGYEITSTSLTFNQRDGVVYIINFEPKDLAA